MKNFIKNTKASSIIVKAATILSLFFFVCNLKGQEHKKGKFNIKKISFLYNNATEDNFIFNDPDYTFDVQTFKFQAFYNLGTWKNFNYELIVQPQVQFLEHQLLNEQFVVPEEEDFETKRREFTELKSMRLYAFELGFSAKRRLLGTLYFHTTIGFGVATIDTRSERLAKGFTFIENLSLGLSYKTGAKIAVYLGANAGHISNLNFQKPNSGYNLIGLEIGLQYDLN